MFDQKLFSFIHDFAGESRFLDFWGVFFSDFFGYLLVIAFFLAVFSLTSQKARIFYVVSGFLAVLISRGIVTEVIRFLYSRPRPFMVMDIQTLIEEELKGAFPSGHAAFYFALAGIAYLMNKKLGWYFLGGALLMGVARVFVGVHWPSDIIGGAGVGLLSSYAVYLLLRDSLSSLQEKSENIQQ